MKKEKPARVAQLGAHSLKIKVRRGKKGAPACAAGEGQLSSGMPSNELGPCQTQEKKASQRFSSDR